MMNFKNIKCVIIIAFVVLLGVYVSDCNGADKKNVPMRIISLVPSVTEALFDLGVGDRVVGNTTYCKRPPEAANKEKVGTAISVNIEKVLTLKPDIVLASTLIRPDEKKKLMNLGINVITLEYPKSFDEICAQFLKLGEILGEEKSANKIVNKAKKDVFFVAERHANKEKPTVFVQIGAKPLVTVNKDSFIHDFIIFAGGVNVTEDIENIKYSREQVLVDNPDVIITVTMGINGDGEKKVWQRYQSMNAIKNDRIYVMDADLFCSPTPITFVKTLEKVVVNIHNKND